MKIGKKTLENKRYKGHLAEEIACDFLIKNNLIILEKNYFKRFGEIDIIAKDEETLVFVEVKFRNNDYYGSPFSSITKRKQEAIRKVATSYLIEKCGKLSLDVRFDAVGILIKNDKMDIDWIKNIF